MASLESLTTFFGWLTVVNVGIYILTALGVVAFRKLMVSMNTRMFGISEEHVMATAFAYVGNFKLAIILLAFAPWLALTLMA
jgi:hypothetical protein